MSEVHIQEGIIIDKPYWYIRYISPEIRDEIEMKLIEQGISFDKFIKKAMKQMKTGDNLNDLNDTILNNFE